MPFRKAVLTTIKDGVQWPESSFAIQTSPPSDLRGLRLGQSQAGDELLAVFVRLPDEDVPRGYALGHLVSAIISERELEDYVAQRGLELRIED